MNAEAILKLQKTKPGYSKSVGDGWPCCLACVLGMHEKCVKPCACEHPAE
jgi:hypothetical protein